MLVAIAVVAAALPVAAVAAPRVPKAQPVVLDFPAGEFCNFGVRLTIFDGTRSHDAPGVVLFTGPVRLSVTNLSTGVEETFNASGPTQIDRPSGNLVLVGPALIGQPASRGVGDPFLIINRGRTEFTSENTIARQTGKTIDICAALS